MWEEIKGENEASFIESHKLKVPGGWIIRTVVKYASANGSSCAVEQTFVSDPEHKWAESAKYGRNW